MRRLFLTSGQDAPLFTLFVFDSRIGTTLLLLQCLEPILLDVDSKNDQKAALASKSHYIYLLLELCASNEFQISDCALQIFNKYKQKHPDIFEIHLNRYESYGMIVHIVMSVTKVMVTKILMTNFF